MVLLRGAWMRELMRRHDLNITELARLVNVQRSHISNILAGRKKPSIDLALRLSRVLGVTVNDLMKKDDFSGVAGVLNLKRKEDF
ncbi:MAG: helix-turn-helix domain-containing protein [Negativicutes bacterium]|nr:helix-turn-helix domain-containing protein [Negativicutes bacterium]